MRLLLVNPWIADVSAFNFWTRPLGLYALAEWAWERGCGLHLVDCLTPFPAPGHFRREPVATPEPLRGFPRRFARYGIPVSEFRARVVAAGAFDAVLMTSAMGYWYPGVVWAVEELRSLRPGVPIFLGGVYPTLWPEHARERSGADRVWAGPLHAGSGDLAAALGLPVDPVRPGRPWWTLGLHDGMPWAAARTARGCPHRCPYCASAQLSGGFSARDPASVVDELGALAALGVRDLAFYDDALLTDFSGRLGPILREAALVAPEMRFHSPNGLHARLVTEEAAQALARSFPTIRLALETVDPDRQGATGAKVQTRDVERAVSRLLRAGARPEAIGVYLLVGLPGQPLAEVREGVRLVRSLGVRPYLSEFSPIPGTPAWDELGARGVPTAALDPLLTNNSVFVRRFGGYPPDELEEVLRSAREPAGPTPRPPLPGPALRT